MTQPARPPKKLAQARVVQVKAHNRTIHAREYYIICKQCDRDVSRVSYGGIPLYCERCRPPQASKSTKSVTRTVRKLPRPVALELVNTPGRRVSKVH